MTGRDNVSTVRPVETSQDIIDIVRHAIEALGDNPQSPSNDKPLIQEELLSVLIFFGEDH